MSVEPRPDKRGAFVLLIGFVALAEQVGLETILGAFAAGALLGLIDRDQVMTHPQFRFKLKAAGFGLFTPIFFVTSGLRFDLNALSSASTVARVPLFLLALLLVRSLPALVYTPQVGRTQAAIAGLLSVVIFPAAGLALLRRSVEQPPSTAAPTPANPVLSADDAALRKTPIANGVLG